MAQFIAFENEVEVNGETILAIVDGAVMKDKALKILAKNGIISPRARVWYPQQQCLDAFREISEKIGPRMLHAIGSKLPDNAKFPSNIETVEDALAAIDVAYHMNHRGGEIGEYHFETTGACSGRMTCHTPYPCDFDRGIIQTMAMRYLPRNSVLVTVEHAPDSGCRNDGDEACVYEISW